MSSTTGRRPSFVEAGGGQGSRAALIMTGANSAHSGRKLSLSGVAPHSAYSRSYENSYKTEPVSKYIDVFLHTASATKIVGQQQLV